MERQEPPPIPDWLEPMVPFERYRLVLSGQAMHVMETGRGRPVLMVHGNPTWGFLYRKVAQSLRGSGLRLIMPDLIGLGFSDKPSDPETHQLESHIHWMGQLIDALEVEELVLVVQDWGGAIGVGALAQRPHLRCGLVALNTILGPPREGFRPTLFHRLSQMPVVSDVLFRGLGFPQNALWAAQGDRGSIRGVVARAYRYPLRSWRDNVAPLALARMVPDSLQHPSIPALRRCQAYVEAFEGPSAIVWGDRDPVLGGVRSWISKLLPGAPVVRTSAGHFLQEEVPSQIAEAVRSVGRALWR